jgi:hypothetical protein
MSQPTSLSPGHDAAHGGHESVRQEPDTTALRFLLLTAVGIAISTVISVYIALWLVDSTAAGLGKLAPVPAAVPGTYEAAGQAGILERGMLVERRGQKADGEIQQLKRQEESDLQSYGWTDRSRGLIRVPIGQAMDQVISAYGPHPPPEHK